MTKGKLFVIDGVDGVGKKTATEGVVQAVQARLQDRAIKVSTMTFPDYKAFFGKMVRQYLNGEFPDSVTNNPYYASLFYAADRAMARTAIVEGLERGDWLILDRYVSSNTAFQGAKLPLLERWAFQERLEKLEYGYFDLPRPNLTIVLNLPKEIREPRTEERREKAIATGQDLTGQVGRVDLHEQNLSYMEEVAQEYLGLAYRNRDWRVVECAKDGNQLAPEVVVDRVVKTIFEINWL